MLVGDPPIARTPRITAMSANALWTLTAALALAASGAEDKKDEDALQGNWKVTSVENNGKKAEAKVIANMRLVVAGDKMTALDGKDVMDEYTFRLDPTTRPRAIDLKVQTGDEKGKTVRGIYRVEGDALTVCVAEPDKKDRPKEFLAPEGSSFMLLVFQRAKP
jgi:uncharacterized protein (TIGR03067 family)